jgi:nitrogen fixation/metabolism regulation signal transduction histidine kinase
VAVVVFYVFFSFPILLLSIMISFILSEEIIRPIVNLEEATRRVAEGDFSFRILARSGDELSLLVSSFNRMVSELERSRLKIMQTEKITAWQEIAQQLAHEIKNPLTPIKLSAQRILRKYQNAPEELGDVLEPGVRSIIREVDSLNHLLQEFRDFARLPNPQRDWVNLHELVEEVAGVYEHSAPELAIQTDGIDRNMMVNADPKQLKQVFGNLFKNAMEAMDRKGQLFVRADLVKKGNSSYCRIQIQDTGPGIHKDSYDKVFNPYFTTKRDGTGLGLSIVERIVFDHKGQIWFETQQGVGTTFFIDLPLET